jgi:hypothetical protein
VFMKHHSSAVLPKLSAVFPLEQLKYDWCTVSFFWKTLDLSLFLLNNVISCATGFELYCMIYVILQVMCVLWYRGTTIFYDALSENHFARKVESTTFLYNERAIRLDPHQLPHKAWQRVLLPFVYDSGRTMVLKDV